MASKSDDKKTCPVCGNWVPAGSICPHCRTRLPGQSRAHRAAWMLVGAGAMLLLGLYLWMQSLGGPPPEDGQEDGSVSVPRVANGTPQPGTLVPVAFGSEHCVPWHVSAAVDPPPSSSHYLVLTSRVVDPGALVLSGFAAACGQDHKVLVLEDLPSGKLAALVEESSPRAIVAVGMGAVARARREAPGVALLYAQVYNPVEAGLDGPDMAGVSPWVPAGPMVRHLLQIFPDDARLGVIHPPGPMAKMARQVTEAVRDRGRDVNRYEIEDPAGLDELLDRAAGECDAWLVLPDRDVIDLATYNRIQTAAERAAIPVGVSDEEHLRRGALAGVGPDSHLIGRQLCSLAGAMARDRLPAGSHVFCPEYSFLAIHNSVLEKLGYMLGPDEIQQAKLYKWH